MLWQKVLHWGIYGNLDEIGRPVSLISTHQMTKSAACKNIHAANEYFRKK